MKEEAKILVMKTERTHRLEQEEKKLSLLTFFYNELLKIEEIIPKDVKANAARERKYDNGAKKFRIKLF